MTAGQRAIPQQGLGGGAAAVLLAGTFAIGLATGLVVPRLQLPVAAAVVASTDQGAAAAAYRSYRQDERTLPVVANQVGDPAWDAYRQGERISLVATTVAASTAWQLYRQDERAPLVSTPTAGQRAWLDYRAGERADRGR